MNEFWHYERDGRRHGPVDRTEIGALIHNRAIDGTTLVWTKGLTGWTVLAQTKLSSFLVTSDVPPTLPTNRMMIALPWLLAVAPLIGTLIDAVLLWLLTEEDYAGEKPFLIGRYCYVTVALNVGLAWLDERRLKAAGVDTTSFSRFVCWAPVYLWKRARSLDQGAGYFWVWMFSLVATVVVCK